MFIFETMIVYYCTRANLRNIPSTLSFLFRRNKLVRTETKVVFELDPVAELPVNQNLAKETCTWCYTRHRFLSFGFAVESITWLFASTPHIQSYVTGGSSILTIHFSISDTYYSYAFHYSRFPTSCLIPMAHRRLGILGTDTQRLGLLGNWALILYYKDSRYPNQSLAARVYI